MLKMILQWIMSFFRKPVVEFDFIQQDFDGTYDTLCGHRRIQASALLNALTVDHSHNVRWARQEDVDQSFAELVDSIKRTDLGSMPIIISNRKRRRSR